MRLYIVTAKVPYHVYVGQPEGKRKKAPVTKTYAVVAPSQPIAEGRVLGMLNTTMDQVVSMRTEAAPDGIARVRG